MESIEILQRKVDEAQAALDAAKAKRDQFESLSADKRLALALRSATLRNGSSEDGFWYESQTNGVPDFVGKAQCEYLRKAHKIIDGALLGEDQTLRLADLMSNWYRL